MKSERAFYFAGFLYESNELKKTKENLKDLENIFKKELLNQDFKRDAVNVVVGIVWQMAQVVLPIYFMLRENTEMVIWSAVLILTSYLLKKYWWDNLKNV